MEVTSGREWGCGISIGLFHVRCQMRPSVIPYILSGRILKNGETRAQGVPMIEYAKRKRKGKVWAIKRGK